MSEYVWRYLSKNIRTHRNASIDDSGACYCDLVFPLVSSHQNSRRERKKFRSYIGSPKRAQYGNGEDDYSSRIAMQQAAKRQDIKREKKMKILSRLFRMLQPHTESEKAIEESKSNLEEINLKLDQMIATLDGENTWFVECHPVPSDERKDEQEK